MWHTLIRCAQWLGVCVFVVVLWRLGVIEAVAWMAYQGVKTFVALAGILVGLLL